MALSKPIRKSDPIYIRRIVNGQVEFVREPMNVVTLDFKDSRGQMTFVEPAGDALVTHNDPVQGDVSDQIRVYDAPPFPKSSF